MAPFRTTALLAFSFVLIIASVSAMVDLTVKGASPVPFGRAGKIGGTIDFSLNDFSGRLVRLSDYRGRNVMVNMWATWCIPCRAEMPDVVAFYHTHQKQDFEILAINIQDDSAKAQNFVRDQGMFFPVLYDPDGSALNVFSADGLPSTFLIDRMSVIRFAWTGQMTSSLMEQRIAPWLGQ